MNARRRIEELLETSDEDRRYDLIAAFVAADPSGAMDQGQRLVGDPNASGRRLGADLLGQVVQAQRSWAPSIVDVLIVRMGEVESDAAVLEALIVALGHADDERGREPVIACVNNPDADVRLAVAWALPSLGLNAGAVAVLRDLSSDPDEDVRDWATFGLAESDATDSDTIEALAARSDDLHYDTRCEAILGLARRHDPRARALVDRELARPMVGHVIESARDLLDS